MKQILSILLIAVLLLFPLSACGDTDKNADTDSSQNSKTKETPSDAPKTDAAHDDVIILNFHTEDLSADNALYHTTNSSLYRYEKDGEGKMINESAYEFCIVGDTIYYPNTDYSSDTTELHRMKLDGSEDTVVYTANSYDANFIMLRGDKLYYEDDGVYEVEPGREDSLVSLIAENARDCFYRDNALYCMTKNTVECYDFASGSTITVDEEHGYENSKLIRGNDNYYLLPDKTDNSKPVTEADVYRFTDDKKTEKALNLKTDGPLAIRAIDHDLVFYQDYSEKDCAFTTFTASLKTGEVQEYKDIRYEIRRISLDGEGCFVASSHHLVYDFDEGVFRAISNLPYGGTAYCYNPVDKACYYKESDAAESIPYLSVELSDEMPDMDAVYSIAPSAQDNDYLRLKRTASSYYGFLFKVPELTVESEDAKKINAEVDKIYLNSDSFGQYYRCEQPENYVTFFTVAPGINSTRSYHLYTVDADTGKRLSNDEIIALITDDKDSFMQALKEECKRQQDFAYNRSITEYEAAYEKRAIREYDQPGITDERLNEVLDHFEDNYRLGYLGNGKVVCTASLAHAAGAGSSTHAFEFTYSAG